MKQVRIGNQGQGAATRHGHSAGRSHDEIIRRTADRASAGIDCEAANIRGIRARVGECACGIGGAQHDGAGGVPQITGTAGDHHTAHTQRTRTNSGGAGVGISTRECDHSTPCVVDNQGTDSRHHTGHRDAARACRPQGQRPRSRNTASGNRHQVGRGIGDRGAPSTYCEPTCEAFSSTGIR